MAILVIMREKLNDFKIFVTTLGVCEVKHGREELARFMGSSDSLILIREFYPTPNKDMVEVFSRDDQFIARLERDWETYNAITSEMEKAHE